MERKATNTGRGPAQRLSASASIQGNLFQFKETWNWNQSPKTIRRGPIRGFTGAARLRMLKEIAVIDWANTGRCLFATLSYPDELGLRTYQQRTTDRTLVLRRIEKHLGKNIATLWRLEWKERKSGAHLGQLRPHSHLCLFGVEYIPWEVLRTMWGEVLGWNGYVHTYVQALTNGTAAAKYAAKYAAKDGSCSLVNAAYLDGLLGRAWGMTRKNLIPRAALTTFRDLPPDVERALRVLGSELRHHNAPETQGSYCVLGDAVQGLCKKILAGALPSE